MPPYLGLPGTNSHQILVVGVFHNAPLIHGIQNAQMQKKKKILVTSLHLYSISMVYPYHIYPWPLVLNCFLPFWLLANLHNVII